MKSKVLKPFIDKETQIGYSEGDIYESKDSKRIASLSEQGYIFKPSEDKKKVKKNA